MRIGLIVFGLALCARLRVDQAQWTRSPLT